MTILEKFINDLARNNTEFLKTGLISPENPPSQEEMNEVWLNRNINQTLIFELMDTKTEDGKTVDRSLFQDYIKQHTAEIHALNFQFFKVMDEEQKARLRKKIIMLLFSSHALNNYKRTLVHQSLDRELEQRCKALLTLMNDSSHAEAKKILAKKPSQDLPERVVKAAQDLYEETASFNLNKFTNEFIASPAQKLYAFNKKLESTIGSIHSVRINWAFDDTTPLTASKGIIDATHYNPLGYSTGLADKNLKAIGQVTGQLSWIAPTISLLLNAFQLGLEANASKQKQNEEEWFSLFFNSLPLEEKIKFSSNLLWTLVNSISFWISYGLGGDTLVGGKLTVDGAGLVLNIAGMLFQLGLQITQLVSIQLNIDQKIKDKQKIDEELNALKARDQSQLKAEALNTLKADIREKSREQKELREEIRALQLQRNTLTAEIFVVTLGIIAGMVLMALGPFAPILPAIGSIVNSVVILVFTITQHTLKICNTKAYAETLSGDLQEKLTLFTGEDNDEQRLLFLEILTLEDEIAIQEDLYRAELMILARTILVKLLMQTLIFFAVSLAPISLALLSVGFGMLEAKILDILTDFFWEPKFLPDIPEVDGGYSLCAKKEDVEGKQLFIEVLESTDNNTSAVVKVHHAQDTEAFIIKINDIEDLKGLNTTNIETYFSKILKITTQFGKTPGAFDFEEKFQERKTLMENDAGKSNMLAARQGA